MNGQVGGFRCRVEACGDASGRGLRRSWPRPVRYGKMGAVVFGSSFKVFVQRRRVSTQSASLASFVRSGEAKCGIEGHRSRRQRQSRPIPTALSIAKQPVLQAGAPASQAGFLLLFFWLCLPFEDFRPSPPLRSFRPSFAPSIPPTFSPPASSCEPTQPVGSPA